MLAGPTSFLMLHEHFLAIMALPADASAGRPQLALCKWEGFFHVSWIAVGELVEFRPARC